MSKCTKPGCLLGLRVVIVISIAAALIANSFALKYVAKVLKSKSNPNVCNGTLSHDCNNTTTTSKPKSRIRVEIENHGVLLTTMHAFGLAFNLVGLVGILLNHGMTIMVRVTVEIVTIIVTFTICASLELSLSSPFAVFLASFEVVVIVLMVAYVGMSKSSK